MDRPRQLLLLTCNALAKLQQELYGPSLAKPCADWYGRVRDLERPSAWLDGVPDNMAVSGVFVRIMRVQAHLLAMVMADGEIDGLHACRVLQHVANDVQMDGWSLPVLRLAAQLGVELPAGPRTLTHMAELGDLLPANACSIRIPRVAMVGRETVSEAHLPLSADTTASPGFLR